MKSKSTTILLSFLLLIILLSGCSNLSFITGHKIRNESEIAEDLLASKLYDIVEKSEITELSIIKRLTDQENRKDTIYVNVSLDHSAATATQAYVMNYTLYNEGWLLDDVEPYYGAGAVWETTPKAMPTNSQIMQMLIENSNSQIDAYYKEAVAVDTSLEQSYFFEEGKYQTTISDGSYSNNPADGIIYRCTAKTTRTFNYVEVEQTQFLEFYFNTQTYTWSLISDAIIDLFGTWYIDGLWFVPFTNAQVVFITASNVMGPDGYSTYEGTCYNDTESIDFSVHLFFPTSQRITHSYDSVDSFFWDSSLKMSISVSPDVIWVENINYTSPNYGVGDELQRIDDSLLPT